MRLGSWPPLLPPAPPRPARPASFTPSHGARRGGPGAGRAQHSCLFFLLVEEKRNLVSILCFKSKISPQTYNPRAGRWALTLPGGAGNPSSVTSAGDALSGS